MRTTVRLDEALLGRAKREASRRGITLTALIEEGLELALRTPLVQQTRKPVRLPVSKQRGWVQPGVELDSMAALLDRMDDR